MLGKVVDGRYKIISQLGEGAMSFVYKAFDIEKNCDVTLKFIKKRSMSSYIEDVVRFQREIQIVSSMEHPGIVKLFGTGDYMEAPYLVMEYLSGRTLWDLLNSGRRYDIKQSIDIVIQIAKILDYVHSKGIIHRDLKPGNIMIIENDRIKLLDFGFALVMELTQIKEEKEIAGTFSYMSPEATGILHKPIDERSDLYSVGVIFYQLASGELPFKGKRISTILHQQIAKLPPSPASFNPGIPELIENIILKLLYKDPEDRYQTAKGLIADLERFQQDQTIFSLGREDKAGRLTYRTRLVGREDEMKKILNLFNKSKSGSGSMCFIKGGAGMGKTRLINELRPYAYQANGIFLEGRCLRQENKPAYQPFKDILNQYINEVKELQNEERNDTVARLKEITGTLGAVIEGISPLVKELIGKSPPLVMLQDYEREHKRFIAVASNFFNRLSTEERPIVFFLDDLQWIDEGSMSLIKEMAPEIGNNRLFFLGSYRDDEVSPLHPISRFVEKSGQKGFCLKEIRLSLFKSEETKKMISRLLVEDHMTKAVEQVFPYVQEKTGGNPFFIVEVIRNLVDEKVLLYKEIWILDQQKLETILIPANVVDMVLKRINALQTHEIKLLFCGAVIGKEFSIDILLSMEDMSNEDLIEIVERCIKLQFLEWKTGVKGKLVFVHDRIREAFLKKMGREIVESIHLRVAEVIESMNKNNLDSVIFDLAHHYFEGGNKEKIQEFSIPAAKKAKESYANEEAERYFKIAMDVIEEKGQKGQGLWVDCCEGLGEVYLTAGKYDEGIKLFEDLLRCKKTKLDKAKVYCYICTAYYKKGDWSNCEEYGGRGLLMLGEKLPRNKNEIIISIIRNLLIHISYGLFLKRRLKRERKLKDERAEEIVHISLPLAWMYIFTEANKFLALILRMFNISEVKLGKSRELALAVGLYAGMCMSIPLFKRSKKYQNIAIEMCRELNDERGAARSIQWLGYCYAWEGKNEEANRYYFESMNGYKKIGDLWEIGMTANGLMYSYYYLGNYEKSLEFARTYLDMSEKIGDNYGTAVAEQGLAFSYICLGEFSKAGQWLDKSLTLSKEYKIWYPRCLALSVQGELKIEEGKILEAITILEEARQLDKKYNFIGNFSSKIYCCLADAQLQRYIQERKDEDLLKFHKVCRKALKKTRHWPNWYGTTLRIQAKGFAAEGRKGKAVKYFVRSISECQKHKRMYEAGKSLYEYGVWLKETGRTADSEKKINEADKIFKDIGARLYIEKTGHVSVFKIKKDMETSPGRLTEERRKYLLLETTQYLSSILDLEELLGKIMDSAIEVTGAERGFLLLYPEEGEKGHKLEVVISRNVDKADIGNGIFQVSRRIISEVEKNKKPRAVVDAAMDEKLKTQASVIKYGLRSVLCAPLIASGTMIGIVYLDNRLVSGLFSDKDLDLINILSAQAAISIQNARLYKKAITDGLTQLYNHTFFQQYLESEVKKQKEHKTPLCLLMIDIDYFKHFNDIYGHQMGDMILKEIASLLKEEVKKTGIAARYGGEEFAVVLPKTSLSNAKAFAEKFREKAGGFKLFYKEKEKVNVTVSIGVVELEEGMDKIELIEKADNALYNAKRLGKNRVEG